MMCVERDPWVGGEEEGCLLEARSVGGQEAKGASREES